MQWISYENGRQRSNMAICAKNLLQALRHCDITTGLQFYPKTVSTVKKTPYTNQAHPASAAMGNSAHPAKIPRAHATVTTSTSRSMDVAFFMLCFACSANVVPKWCQRRNTHTKKRQQEHKDKYTILCPIAPVANSAAATGCLRGLGVYTG